MLVVLYVGPDRPRIHLQRLHGVQAPISPIGVDGIDVIRQPTHALPVHIQPGGTAPRPAGGRPPQQRVVGADAVQVGTEGDPALGGGVGQVLRVDDDVEEDAAPLGGHDASTATAPNRTIAIVTATAQNIIIGVLIPIKAEGAVPGGAVNFSDVRSELAERGSVVGTAQHDRNAVRRPGHGGL